MTKQVVIIHGSYGNPGENWFPWLAKEVTALGYQAITPEFPTPVGQSLNSWLEVFHKSVSRLTPGTVLVGHSLGAAFILRILERTRQPVLASVLVSGFLGSLGLPEFDKVNAEFVLGPVDWPRVRENAGIVQVFNGDNDPYVPLDKGREIAMELGVSLSIVKNGGHINAAAGFAAFPELLESIRRLTPGQAA